MSNSVLGGIINYPFDIPIPNVISQYLYGQDQTWVNTGFFATSYMHFGFIGIILFSIIVGFVFKLIDSIVKNRIPLWLGIAVMIVPINSLVSADLPTALLTHGIGLGILFLWLISSKKTKVKFSTSFKF
jgi:hypothetical protein